MRDSIPALVAKDFLWMRREKRALLIAASVILAPGLSASPFFAAYFCALPCLTFMNYLFGYDEKYGADRFFASLPVSRSSMVAARYMGILLVALASLAVAYGSDLALLALRSGAKPFGDVFLLSFAAFFTLNLSLTVPLYFKVGISKARAVNLVLMVIPVMAGSVLLGWDKMMPGAAPGASGTAGAPFGADLAAFRMPGFVLPLAVLAAAGILALSALVSIRIFEAKEL